MKNFINRLVFFVGWVLSPFTFWNDAFVNIPLAYLFANIFIWFFHRNFVYTVIIFYWLTNFVGLFMMYASGRYMIKNRKDIVKELVSLAVTMLIYTAVLVILDRVRVLKPLPLPGQLRGI